VATIVKLTHPEMEWVPDSRFGEGPIRGRENVIRFFTDRAEMFAKLCTELERFWRKDDKVLAERLSVPKSWVYEASRRGEIPTIELGRYKRYREEAVDACVREREQGPRSNGDER
jgi:hypothetical protein